VVLVRVPFCIFILFLFWETLNSAKNKVSIPYSRIAGYFHTIISYLVTSSKGEPRRSLVLSLVRGSHFFCRFWAGS